MITRSIWRKRGVKTPQTGCWEYQPHFKSFYISLDSRDPVTGEPRRFRVYGDAPDFNGYVRDAT